MKSKRHIGIKSFAHVSWAVWKLDDALPILTRLLGMKEVERWQNREEGFEGATLDAPGSQTQFEVLAPLSEGSFLTRFLRERGPGLHHVSFEVSDIEDAELAVQAFGLKAWQGIRYLGDRAEIYLHPRDASGTLFQFFTNKTGHKRRRERQD